MKALDKYTVSVTEESFIFFQMKPKVMICTFWTEKVRRLGQNISSSIKD